MAERLQAQPRARGISRSGLRGWGIFLVALGALSLGVLQLGLLDLPNTSAKGLLEALQNDPNVMAMASVALILEALGYCAIPVFAFLAAEGVAHTESLGKYLARVLGLAVVAELPYNLLTTGKWLSYADRNPVFGVVLALVVLYFWGRYGQNSFGNWAIRIFIVLAGLLWSGMLGIEGGAPMVLLTAVFSAARGKKAVWMILGCVLAAASSVFDLMYVAMPFSFIILHFYNGEKGESSRAVDYAAYPAVILAFALVGAYLL